MQNLFNKITYISLIRTIVLCTSLLIFSFPALANMQSDSSLLPSSVLSNGGAPMGSQTSQLNATLAQSSTTVTMSSSATVLHSGFWTPRMVGGMAMARLLTSPRLSASSGPGCGGWPGYGRKIPFTIRRLCRTAAGARRLASPGRRR